MRRVFSILFLIFSLVAHAQNSTVLPGLVATSPALNIKQVESKVDRFISNIRGERQRSDLVLLRKVFNKTQREFLHQYVPYSGFQEIFETGKYDCLTATSLFAIVLDELDFHYEIVETNYHIFILVKLTKEEVLLETTDRFDGFVTRPAEIEKRIGAYRKGLTEETQRANAYRYSFDLYHAVSATQLPGLLYYNQAVKAYNAGKLEECAGLLVKAHDIYDTPRISEFSYIFVKAVLASDLDSPVKQRIIEQFRPLAARRANILAAR